ncbi:MAG: hypothetical protein ACKVG4_10120 [Longimicrobiales bacterium]
MKDKGERLVGRMTYRWFETLSARDDRGGCSSVVTGWVNVAAGWWGGNLDVPRYAQKKRRGGGRPNAHLRVGSTEFCTEGYPPETLTL